MYNIEVYNMLPITLPVFNEKKLSNIINQKVDILSKKQDYEKA